MDRRLYRSRTDSIVAGVAAGLARYLNADPALVRIAWAVLIPLTGGAALVAYVVAWIVVPEEPSEGAGATGDAAADPVTGERIAAPGPSRIERPPDGRAGIVVGIGLVLLGLWFLLREYLPDIDWSLIWPLVIVGVGILILAASMRRRA
jgi:phage shock protein PspC (stress-responsive transcriptional regulator)